MQPVPLGWVATVPAPPRHLAPSLAAASQNVFLVTSVPPPGRSSCSNSRRERSLRVSRRHLCRPSPSLLPLCRAAQPKEPPLHGLRVGSEHQDVTPKVEAPWYPGPSRPASRSPVPRSPSKAALEQSAGFWRRILPPGAAPLPPQPGLLHLTGGCSRGRRSPWSPCSLTPAEPFVVPRRWEAVRLQLSGGTTGLEGSGNQRSSPLAPSWSQGLSPAWPWTLPRRPACAPSSAALQASHVDDRLRALSLQGMDVCHVPPQRPLPFAGPSPLSP